MTTTMYFETDLAPVKRRLHCPVRMSAGLLASIFNPVFHEICTFFRPSSGKSVTLFNTTLLAF